MFDFQYRRYTDLGRPYLYARRYGYTELAEYLKSQEDPKLHDEAYMTELAISNKMPQELIAFLKSDDPVLRQEGDEYDIGEIRFQPFMELFTYKIKRTNYIVLSTQVGEYSFYLLWHPSKKKICYYDVEMEIYGEFGSYKKFMERSFY